MPSLYAPSEGVNRKIKTLYAPSGGINRKLKALYTPYDGINRKIFSYGDYAFYIASESGGTVTLRKYKMDGTLVSSASVALPTTQNFTVSPNLKQALYNPQNGKMYVLIENNVPGSETFDRFVLVIFDTAASSATRWGIYDGLYDGGTLEYSSTNWALGINAANNNAVVGFANTSVVTYGLLLEVTSSSGTSLAYTTANPHMQDNLMYYNGYFYGATSQAGYISKGQIGSGTDQRIAVTSSANFVVSKFGCWACGTAASNFNYGVCNAFAKRGAKSLSQATGTWCKLLYDSTGNLVIVTTTGVFYFTVNTSTGEPTYLKSVLSTFNTFGAVGACITPDDTILVPSGSTYSTAITKITADGVKFSITVPSFLSATLCCDMGIACSFPDFY